MNSWIWILILLGCCGNNGCGNGYGWANNNGCGSGCENHVHNCGCENHVHNCGCENHTHNCGCGNTANNNSCGGNNNNNCSTPIQPRTSESGCMTPPPVPYYVSQDDCGCN